MSYKQLSTEEWKATFDQMDEELGQRYKVLPNGKRVYLATRPFFGGGKGILIPFRRRSAPRGTPPAPGASGELRANCEALDATPREAEEGENSEGS